MAKDDLLKAPLTPYGGTPMKIKYKDSGMGTGEGVIFFILVFFIILPTIMPFIIIFGAGVNVDWGDRTVWDYIVAFLPNILLVGFMVALFIILRKRRLKKNNSKAQELIDRGTVVMGIITRVIEQPNGSRNGGPFYSYVINYKKPGTEIVRTFHTPPLDKCPFIKAEDLPLDVKLYVQGESAYADEIMNAPVDKMLSRKKVQSFWTGLAMIGFLISCVSMFFGFPLVGIIAFAAALLTLVIAGFKNREA